MAPRRLIARRRPTELSPDHSLFMPPNYLEPDDYMDDILNGDTDSMATIASDVEQPESPPVIKYF